MAERDLKIVAVPVEPKSLTKKTTPPVLIQFGLKDMDVAPSGTEKKKPAITI
ncbi:MAG: hypothetical protein V3V97_07320 [Hyphomicrobiaceae bacterium]